MYNKFFTDAVATGVCIHLLWIQQSWSVLFTDTMATGAYIVSDRYNRTGVLVQQLTYTIEVVHAKSGAYIIDLFRDTIPTGVENWYLYSN